MSKNAFLNILLDTKLEDKKILEQKVVAIPRI